MRLFYVAALTLLHVVRQSFGRYCIETMVAQAGQPSGWPVFVEAGYANLVWATTNEIGVSGGSYIDYSTENATWLQPQLHHTCNLPFGFWLYAMQNYAPYRTMMPLLPRMNIMSALCWRITMYCRLLDVCRYEVHAMFDDTPLTPEELTDQCRALTYAVIELDNPMAKEALLFVLAERLEVLSATLDTPDTLGGLSGVANHDVGIRQGVSQEQD